MAKKKAEPKEEDIVLTIDYLKEMKDDIKKCSEFLKIYCFEKMF